MKVQVSRNLDRPFSLLGIKGKYILLLGAGLLVVVILSLALGKLFGSFAALACALILSPVLYLGILEVQRVLPPRSLARWISGKSVPRHIIIRHKPWIRST